MPREIKCPKCGVLVAGQAGLKQHLAKCKGPKRPGT